MTISGPKLVTKQDDSHNRDDLDSADWEDHLLGPDDDEIEAKFFEQSHEGDKDDKASDTTELAATTAKNADVAGLIDELDSWYLTVEQLKAKK